MRRIFAFLFFFCALSFAPAARAQISDEGAARLKALLTEILDAQRQQAVTRHGELKTEGEIVVEKKPTYYAAAFPQTTYLGSDRTKFVIGRIAINAMPGSTPDLWKMAVAIPTPLRFYEDEKPVFTLSLGRQTVNGIWSQTLGNFVKLDSRIEDVALKEESGRFNLSVPLLTGQYDLNETSGANWSGPMRIRASNVQADIASHADQPGAKIGIGEVAFDYNLKDLSPQAVKIFREQTGAIAENAADPTAGGVTSVPHAKAVYALVSEYLRTAFDALSGGLRVKALTVQPHDPQSPAFSLGEGGFGMDLSGFRSGQVALGFSFDYDGMKITPEPAEIGPLAPGTLKVNLLLDKVPLHKLLDLGQSVMESAEKNPQSFAQLAMMQAAISLPALLSEAGTRIILKDNRIAGALYEAALNGTAVTKADAAKGAIVNGRVEIVGLEDVVAWLKSGQGKMEKSDADALLRALTAIQMVGQQATAGNGKPSRTYDFLLNEQGQMLLNGTDIETVVQAIQGGTDTVPAPAPGK